MCSYRFEPTTYHQFKVREALDQKIELLRKAHLELLRTLRTQTNNPEAEFKETTQQLEAAKKLEEGIHQYMNMPQH
ncbi:hypothetical protein [Maribacter sp. 2210JD10-5]|uniref:hypothetical protein n=1 Tax=Maribacter sp. 2210JD10-5 TaxID=3386272 RepID=UPI0039BD199A